nr:acetyl-CoA carboxylase beta subunit [Carpinus putoensis]YP_009378586.1 acetyl-CoA carboxylase beta subunit [Carpinus tientaiensis]APS87155.1 acetyl-CoA carboxylase beta subunit [Carpinus putoensis]ARH56070.1 acetyl-CoA carboxylase beta subunit [Carpinus tientaiensis]
MVFSCK